VVSERYFIGQIYKDVILDGEGRLTIEGVDAGGGMLFVAQDVHAKLIGLSLVRGNTRALGVSGFGGCIRNWGTLDLVNVNLRDCWATNGGAISNNGTLKVTDSWIGENEATDRGGAIYNVGSLHIQRSAIASNKVVKGRLTRYSRGGAIANANGTVRLVDSTLADNAMLDENGATWGHGGAIWSVGGRVALFNSTLTHNTAILGGAIYSRGELDLRASTVAWNFTTPFDYADIDHSDGPLTVLNTVIADTCSFSFHLAIKLAWFSVESPGRTCGLAEYLGCYHGVPENVLGLGTIAPNGWPAVWTCLPASDSFLLDKIPEAVCSSAADQRSVPRPWNGSCDIGSVERSPSDPPP